MSSVPVSSDSATQNGRTPLRDSGLQLPLSIASLLPAHDGYEFDMVGRTGSFICLYESLVLKVQVADEESRRERELLAWLSGRLPGRMLAEPGIMDNTRYLVARLTEALRLLDGVEAGAARWTPELRGNWLKPGGGSKRVWFRAKRPGRRLSARVASIAGGAAALAL